MRSVHKSYNPKLWGQHAWNFLYYIAFSYPDNPTPVDKNHVKVFFTEIGSVLPCTICRQNFVDHLQQYPITDYVLNNKTNLITWLII